MNLGTIRKEVYRIVGDDSYSAETIDRYINEAVMFAAAEVNIPAYKKMVTVTALTDQNNISVSSVNGDTFTGRLNMAVCDGSVIDIVPTIESLLEIDPDLDDEGSISYVCLENKTLYYNPIPTEDTSIILVIYVDPPTLQKDTDIPSDFPKHLHRGLFVHGACWHLYNEQEDGITDDRVNQAVFFNHAYGERNPQSGLNQLRKWVARNRNNCVTSIWRY
jgi:hypothetical protein